MSETEDRSRLNEIVPVGMLLSSTVCSVAQVSAALRRSSRRAAASYRAAVALKAITVCPLANRSSSYAGRPDASVATSPSGCSRRSAR